MNTSYSATEKAVKLDWTDLKTQLSGGYHLQRVTSPDLTKPASQWAWQDIASKYGQKIKVLNVFPVPIRGGGDHWSLSGNMLKSWLQKTSEGQTVDKGLVQVDEAPLNITGDSTAGPDPDIDAGKKPVYNSTNPSFNDDPDRYLKDAQGNYRYDALYFGSLDWNNHQDLSRRAQAAVAKFGDSGRGLIFGHDTIMGNEGLRFHQNFVSFAAKTGLTVYGDDSPNIVSLGNTQVKLTPDISGGGLTIYPWRLQEDAIYNISMCHTYGQYYMYNGGGQRWMTFAEPPTWGDKKYLKDAQDKVIGDNNFYLVTKNNYAMIQTGHTTREATVDEAKLNLNALYYVSQLSKVNHGQDPLAVDQAQPSQPAIQLAGSAPDNVTGDQLTLKLTTQDLGSDYYYRVNAETWPTYQTSDVVRQTVTSGIKGFVYSLDNNPNGTPPIQKDAYGQVTNATAPNDTTAPAPLWRLQLSLNKWDHFQQYLHVVSVDQANNVSQVKTVALKDFLKTDLQLAGYAFADENGNGLAEAEEKRFSGLQPRLYRVTDQGQLVLVTHDTTGAALPTVTTDTHGNYCFQNLLSGRYQIGWSSIPAGYFPTLFQQATTKQNNSQLALQAPVTDPTGQKVAVTRTIALASSQTQIHAGWANQQNYLHLQVPDLNFGSHSLDYRPHQYATTDPGTMNQLRVWYQQSPQTPTPPSGYRIAYQVQAELSPFQKGSLTDSGSSLSFTQGQQTQTLMTNTATTLWQKQLTPTNGVIAQDQQQYDQIKLAVPVATMLKLGTGQYRATITYTLVQGP
ncbi:hypothetical protein HU830_03645 [Lactobacillus sp. DCY120]|uniref:SD-repeat containing protein B domain-containing protein n=1 Tax=Bombilactobacillus apium TaxID=2675299 RepID=A0A850R6K4_9LACO|nr:SdrD B-like domain-containing protein [Bombilactobacillus apium]NVY96272.1 hypothetical protein [Bombilactobacillus apium]